MLLALIFAEGWHSGIKGELRKTSHNIFKQIAALKNEHMAKMFRLNQLRGGHNPVQQRATYVEQNRRLKNIALRYDNTERMLYLRSIAHATKF